MDTTITAAVVGAAGAIVAAIVGVILSRRRAGRSSSNVVDKVRKANSLRLGFESGMLDFLEALRVHELWSAIGNEGIALQREKIVALGTALGMEEMPDEPQPLLKALSDRFMSEPLSRRRTYDIGFNIASGFGTGVLMQVAAVPGRRNEIEQMAFDILEKTESVLEDAELSTMFLKPIRHMWAQFSESINDGKHDIAKMTKTLRKCVEDLALGIERAK